MHINTNGYCYEPVYFVIYQPLKAMDKKKLYDCQREYRKRRYKYDDEYREKVCAISREYQRKKREEKRREKYRKDFIKSVRKGISIHLQEHLREYINQRPALNCSELGRLSGWNQSSFLEWARKGGRNMPDEVIGNLTIVLKDYGYQPKVEPKEKAQVRA